MGTVAYGAIDPVTIPMASYIAPAPLIHNGLPICQQGTDELRFPGRVPFSALRFQFGEQFIKHAQLGISLPELRNIALLLGWERGAAQQHGYNGKKFT